MPASPDAEMPPSYRIWQACRRNQVLWWDGGMSNQPFLLMQEFAVYDDISARFKHATSLTPEHRKPADAVKEGE